MRADRGPRGGPPSPAAAPGLRRTLGVWRVTWAGIGVILGAGVYSLIGPAAGQAGNALWAAFALAGAAAGLTGYSYARLGTLRPRDAPEFQYTALAFGTRAGFVAGWLILVADLLATAAVALGFAGYLAHLWGTPTLAGALAVIAVSAAVLLGDVAESVTVAIVLTVLEVAGLLVIALAGAPGWGRTGYLEAPGGATGISAAAALIFFAYLGFEEIGNFAEEMRRPERDLPRALFAALLASTAVYVLVALSATALVDWRELAASSAPLALAARRALGPGAEVALAVVGLAATGNTVLLLLMAGARSVYGMAASGVLPGRLARVGRRSVPVPATLLVAGMTGALVLVGDVGRAAALTDAAVLTTFLVVNLSLAVLAGRRVAPGGPVRRAADIAIPAVAALLCLWLIGHTGWLSIGFTAALVVAGLGLAAGVAPRTAPRD